MKNLCSALAALVFAAGSASSEPIYSNLTDSSGGFNITNFDNWILADDMVVGGGGELRDISFTVIYSGGGFGGPGSINVGAEVSLYLDDGDGLPQLPDGSDTLLWSGSFDPVSVSLNQVVVPTLDITPGIQVNAGDRIWLAIRYQTDAMSFVNFGTELYDDFTVGSSDGNIYRIDLDNNNDVQPFPVGGSGMGAILTVVEECPADLNGDGVVDADDFFLFLQWFAAGDPRADMNGDGVLDADDFFEYLALFAQGCD